MSNRKPPIALRNIVDIADLCRTEPCDEMHVLGSFWPNSRTSFESRLVKAFKASNPIEDFKPHIFDLCKYYSELIVESLGHAKIDWIVRVLSSAEKEAESSRPQSLLVDMLCSMTGAHSATDVFFKSEARPPMRVVNRLAGQEALKARLQYVVQDLFIRPEYLSGNVLIIDDICNTGASIRVYAFALKELAKVGHVCAFNLAATRFAGGKDGRGMLRLDTNGLSRYPSFGEVWMDDVSIFHNNQDCPSIQKPAASCVRFLAERTSAPCPTCIASNLPKRKWWQI